MLLRPSALPSLIGWGFRFIRESRPDLYLANTRKNVLLARYSIALMAQLRRDADIEYGAYARGSLQVFRSEELAVSTLAWVRRLGEFGLQHRTLSVAELVAVEPALAPIAAALIGGIHMPHDEGGDAHRYCCAMAGQLQKRDVQIHYGIHCRPLSMDAKRMACVADSSGRRWDADTVVLAAGTDSARLARSVGLALPVRPVKGYSITAPLCAGALAPRVPVVDPHLHVAAVPLAAGGLRVAGTAEFAGYNRDLMASRITNIFSLLKQLYPEYARSVTVSQLAPWTGLRPMCPDGVPLLGPTPIRNLFLNTGHGHLGWTLAAASARVVSDLAFGRCPEIDPAPYGLARFSRGHS
jgi:D-amino-acid dehydrogenase